MRRLVFPVIVASGLVMTGPSSAFAAEPTPTVSVKATAGKKVCKITDDRLDELSGIVATRTGFIVVNDSTDRDANKKVFFLDTKCKVVDEVSYSGNGPRDPEDLILSPDGRTLWIADIGDNNFNKDERRETVVLWTMPADGSKKPVIHRLAYPEGAAHDAEAMLLTGDNIPLIVTKEIGKLAAIYQPSAALEAGNETGIPLKKVGDLQVSATETPGNPYARIGNKTVDGGAVAPGGGKVVLRTYTDALEWDVKDNDVLAALKGKPRTTGLPNETLGEAITYSADGKTFYTVSDMSGDTEADNYILSYTPATTVAVVKQSAADADSGNGKAWYADLTIDQIMYLVGGVGIIGLMLVGAGVLGIARHRKRVALLPPADLDRVPSEPGGPQTELIGVGGPRGGGVYGGGARSGPAPGGPGGVYGGGAQRGGAGGNGAGGGGAGGNGVGGGGVYGGGGQGPQYGRPQEGGRPRGPVYGGGGGAGGGGQQYGRPPQGGQRPQGGGQRPQGGGGQGQRPQGVYGQPSGRPDRPPQRNDGYADRNGRPDGRFDNPGYGRR